MKKRYVSFTVIVLLLLSLVQSASAFRDVGAHANSQKILSLKEQGILNGYPENESFNPDQPLTYASGLAMIIKGFDLNIDHIRFIKAPKASDYFTNVKDDQWYSPHFIVASVLNLDLPKDVRANDAMSKEQFAHLLFKAMMSKGGDYAFIKIYMNIADEDQVNPEYMHSIQKLLISKIATVDEKQLFHPKTLITRGDAAGWLYDAMLFVKENTVVPVEPEPFDYQMELTVTPVNDDVNKVTITAQMPHPGYGLKINTISFENENAVIHTEVIQPDPDKMYPMVITEVSVSTYVDAAYKPILPEQQFSSMSE